jgi:hypothetical protein
MRLLSPSSGKVNESGGVRMLQNAGNYTGNTQKNVVVSKINKEFISHPTWAQHTLSA